MIILILVSQYIPLSVSIICSLNFPEDFAELAGVHNLRDDVVIDNANAIKEQYVGKNVTSSDTLKMLDYLVQSVYHSTPNKEASPYACEFSGLAELSCDVNQDMVANPRADGNPIRSATLAGLFVPALWATDGQELSLKQAKKVVYPR